MSYKDNGGPAFPGGVAGGEYGNHAGEPMHDGMTLRDYFAAAALQGAVANSHGLATVSKDERSPMILEAALIIYEFADAMLTARSQHG